MTAPLAGTVVFGDVVDSRHDPGPSAWLRSLCADFEAAYPREARLASFAFTQGDEIQGLLAPGADPFLAVLRGALRPGRADAALGDRRGRRRARYRAGDRADGPGVPRRPGARSVAPEAHRDGLIALTGDAEADALLAELGPLLPALLADLTARQREVARLILLDDLRRSEAADRLKVSRPTVSVIADRARVRHIGGLARALATIFLAVQRVPRRPRLTRRRERVARGAHRGGERRVTDTVLVLTWLVFAHLVADFVLQNDWIAMNKATGGREGSRALAVHGFHVALCLAPAVLAWGLRGLVYLVVVTVTHMIVDRWKVQATRRAEAEAQAQARARIERTGQAPTSGLGVAWTPWPGILFLADQVLHLTIAIVGWLVILAGAALLPQFVDVVNRILGSWDRATVNAVTLTSLVIVSLFIVNTRAAYYFVLALVSPRDLAPGTASAAPEPHAAPPAPAGYTVRVGPLVATVEPRTAETEVDGDTDDPMAEAEAGTPGGREGRVRRRGAPGRAGADRGDDRRPRASPDRRVHAHRRRGRRGVRHRGEDHRAVQAARRPGLRRVLPAGDARERRRRDQQLARGARRAGQPVLTG